VSCHVFNKKKHEIVKENPKMQSSAAGVGSQAEKSAGLSTALGRKVEDISILRA